MNVTCKKILLVEDDPRDVELTLAALAKKVEVYWIVLAAAALSLLLY